MPFGANDVIRATATWLWNNSDTVQNVFHWQISDMGTATDDQVEEFAMFVVEEIFENIVDAIVDNFTTDSINIFNETDSEPHGAFAWPNITAGTNTGHGIPINSTIHAFARTAANQVRGDKQWMSNSEAGNNDGVLESADLAAYVAATQDWVDDFTELATGLDLITGVVRSATGFVGVFAPFLSGVTQSVYHSLRNRRPGVGS